MKLKETKNKQRGFTLIELLVVISIISLLASILLVNIRSANEKAKLAALAQDARAIQTQIDIARDTASNNVYNITGACPGCGMAPGVRINDQDPWILSSLNDGWAALGFAKTPIDPWGSPFMIRPKEEVPGSPCSYHDQVYSAGKDGILDSYFTYSSGSPGDIVHGLGDDYVFSITFYKCSEF
jgi:general secretion pathway protein G